MTIIMTWPLFPASGEHVLGAIYHWDAYCNTMILGSRIDALFSRGPLSLYDNYFFAPLPSTIVFNENHFGLSLIFAPFYLLSGNPLFAYNMTLMSSMALSVFMTYLLVHHLTRNSYAGFVAGIAFAFCPYVFFEIGRIQLVATQWISASFLFLHRAIERNRLVDVIGFWVSYVFQVGTCLYYAMFLIPLLSTIGIVLILQRRPPRQFWFSMIPSAVVAGTVVLQMVRPYFSIRRNFDLERSLSFASRYDGKLSFLANVHTTNRTLVGMHHIADTPGAHEEIAFSGFTIIALAALAIVPAFVSWIRSAPLSTIAALLGRGLSAGLLLAVAVVVSRSMLVGAAVFLLAYLLLLHPRLPKDFLSGPKLYGLVAIVAITMFLGLFPFSVRGEKVHGLYYYFHVYFPGFDGIRKVSRQAVMVTFALAVMGGFGASRLFASIARARHRRLVGLLLVFGIGLELRTFPHPVEEAWAGERVPSAYDFIRTLPKEDLVAAMPQDRGKRRFVGDAGMAYHDYLSLYHKHRFVNGQSSWMPPVTELVRRSLAHLPNPSASRMLQMVGTNHLLIHSADLPAGRRDLPEMLVEQSKLYRLAYQDGSDYVFSFVEGALPALNLLPTPPLPEDAIRLPPAVLTTDSPLQKDRLHFATDDQLHSHWSTRRPQERGQYLEVALRSPKPIVALEIRNPHHEMYLPLSYVVDVQLPSGEWRRAAQQPQLRLFRDQIFSPRTFVYRIVFEEPIECRVVRLRIDQPLPGYDFVVHELSLYMPSE